MAEMAEMEKRLMSARLPVPTSMKGFLAPVDADAIPEARHPALDRAQAYQCALGSVLLTSGLGQKSAGHHALDFALISLDPARFPLGPNVLNNVRTWVPFGPCHFLHPPN
jgi:hypothetical protein